MSDARTDEELRAACAAGDDAAAELSRRARAVAEIVDNRLARLRSAPDEGMRKGAAFSPEELSYAAAARCICGAGLAYPSRGGLHGAWECSAILRAIAPAGSSHTEAKPFAFWSVKGEGQPSAGYGTTRGADEPGCPACGAFHMAGPRACVSSRKETAEMAAHETAAWRQIHPNAPVPR